MTGEDITGLTKREYAAIELLSSLVASGYDGASITDDVLYKIVSAVDRLFDRLDK